MVIWRETLPVIRDFWAVGTGAGTYAAAMLVYQQSAIWIPHLAAWAHFNQAHNHYLQVAAEGGVLVGAPVATALALLAVFLRRSLAADRTEMFWIRLGAAAALAGVAAQSVWEIPLVMPANGVLAACLAAVVLHERGEPPRQPARSSQVTSE
jgi:O-antigen ligase